VRGIEAPGELKEKIDRMNRIARFLVLAAATILLMVSATGCKRLEARNQLNKGVQAYKQAKYEEAIDHFQKAVSLDPTYPMTRLYLATAYAQQVVPGLDTPENEKTAQMAINGFMQVLQEHPDDITSLKQIAALNYDLKKFGPARDWQLKVLAADPKDAEAAYTIGVVDWTQAYQNAIHALQSAGLQDDGQGNAKMPKPVCKMTVSSICKWPSTFAPTTTTPCSTSTSCIAARPTWTAATMPPAKPIWLRPATGYRRPWVLARLTKRKPTRKPAAAS
jgi:hypothetical protein